MGRCGDRVWRYSRAECPAFTDELWRNIVFSWRDTAEPFNAGLIFIHRLREEKFCSGTKRAKS